MRDNTSRPRRTTHSKTSKPSRPSSRRSTTTPGRSTSARSDSRRSPERSASGGRDRKATGARGGSTSSSRSTTPRSTSRPRKDSDSTTRSRSERSPSRTSSSRPRRDEPSRSRRSENSRPGQKRDSRSTRTDRSERQTGGRFESRSSQTSDSRSGSTRPRRDESSRPSSRRDTRPPGRGRTERDNGRGRNSSPKRYDEKRTRTNVRSERKFEPPKPSLDIPKDIDVTVVPKSVLAEIRLIAPHTQDLVKQYLAVAITAIESAEFDRAYDYAKEARNLASRLATVREIAGLSAYYAGKWAEALSEFKTYMRMTGDPHFLPIMADCERGLNRPERAIALSKSRNVQDLDAAGKIEMRIVVSGARRDLRQLDNALAILEIPELRSGRRTIEVARLRYAYAEVLLMMGRKTEARDWFVKASLADVEEETDASERALKLGEI